MAGPAWIVFAVRFDGKATSFLREQLSGKELAANAVVNTAYKGARIVDRFTGLLRACVRGVYTSNMYYGIMSEGTLPTGQVVCTQANAAGDTITWTYGDKTVVLTEGGAGEGGFARGASNTTCAANLHACINAHSILKTLFTASSAVAGTCKIDSKIPGGLASKVVLTTNDATAFAITQMSAGTNTAEQFLTAVKINRNL